MGERKMEGFTEYLKSVLQNSMLTGIPQIASAASVRLKILKSLVFVFCLIGFIYQSMDFMNMYWEYRTIQDIKVEYPKRAEMPSITLCANNGINTTHVCSDPKFSSDCDLLETFYGESPCSCQPHICKGLMFNATVPSDFLMYELSHSEYEVYQPYLIPLSNLVNFCHFQTDGFVASREKRCVQNYQNIRCDKEDYDNLHTCYTMHTLLNRPDGEEQIISTQETPDYLFDAIPLQYNVEVPDPQLQLSIHNSKNILNPYVYGYSLKRGKSNIFHVTKTVKQLLPPPYDNKCKDYLAEWKNRGGRGPTTEKECIVECRRNCSMEKYGCVHRRLLVPTNDRVCYNDDIDKNILKDIHDCAAKNCRPACYEISYQVRKEVLNYDYIIDCDNPLLEVYLGLARVVIKLNGMQTTTYLHNPQFEYIETYSYIGGYVGMWLGISLIAVFDFFDTLVVILKYPFRQIMQRRARKRRVRQIQRRRRPDEYM